MSIVPFPAMRSLRFIADHFSKIFPIGAAVIKEDMYVDELLTGADSIDELDIKAAEESDILPRAGLKLAKWNTRNIHKKQRVGISVQSICERGYKNLGDVVATKPRYLLL